MTRMTKWLLLVLGAVLMATVGATAQTKYANPEKIERATTKDEAGLLQWAKYDAPQCTNCKGTGKVKCTTCERYPEEAKKCPDCGRKEAREAACHACAGTGSFPDPLEQVLCPGCRGAGYVVCGLCPGSGIVKPGGSERWGDCPCCRGDGWSECMVCEGKRLVEVAKLKPSLKDADVDVLKAALKATDEMLTQLGAFTPTAKNTRKEVKELEKVIKLGEKLYPPLKDSPKNVKQLMKTVYAGSQIQGSEEREVQALQRIQAGVDAYLKHQKRMMELALKRAEANASARGGR